MFRGMSFEDAWGSIEPPTDEELREWMPKKSFVDRQQNDDTTRHEDFAEAFRPSDYL